MICLQSQLYCDISVVPITTVTSLQSYSLNKFCYLKINAQIFNGPTAVLLKMFRHVYLHTQK